MQDPANISLRERTARTPTGLTLPLTVSKSYCCYCCFYASGTWQIMSAQKFPPLKTGSSYRWTLYVTASSLPFFLKLRWSETGKHPAPRMAQPLGSETPWAKLLQWKKRRKKERRPNIQLLVFSSHSFNVFTHSYSRIKF